MKEAGSAKTRKIHRFCGLLLLLLISSISGGELHEWWGVSPCGTHDPVLMQWVQPNPNDLYKLPNAALELTPTPNPIECRNDQCGFTVVLPSPETPNPIECRNDQCG